MAIVLALVSALAYGLSDFLGGILSRRTSAWSVAVVAQASSAGCTALLALFVPGDPLASDFRWAALAAVGSGAGAGFLYRGFATGRMGVVAPVSALGAALVPVLVGVFSGERPAPLVWVGVIAALPAIWLVSRTPGDGSRDPAAADPAPENPAVEEPSPDQRADEEPGRSAAGLVDGVLAGLGFGLLFAALGQVPDSAGWWPLALCQALSVLAVVAVAGVLRADWVPRGRTVRLALFAGPLGATATGAFLLASQQGYLAVAGVLASLYPASTVLLAALVLHEKVHRAQGVGLGLCALAVVLVAGG
ncbi:MAG TPA: DMT family transporter [Nocardioidaceae bacterium]|nr:DMT family transporter [Nocardioidaceae bacterium]